MILPAIRKIAPLVGTVWLLQTAYRLFRFISFHIPFTGPSLARYNTSSSSDAKPCYALITGASAGIGLGIADGLLHRSLGGVILLGHDLLELEQASLDLKRKYPNGDIKIVHHDVLASTPESLRAALESVLDLRITMLVNNVGGAPIPKPKSQGIRDVHFERHRRFHQSQCKVHDSSHGPDDSASPQQRLLSVYWH